MHRVFQKKYSPPSHSLEGLDFHALEMRPFKQLLGEERAGAGERVVALGNPRNPMYVKISLAKMLSQVGSVDPRPAQGGGLNGKA